MMIAIMALSLMTMIMMTMVKTMLPGKSGEGDMDGGGRGRESSVCHCPGILAYMVSLDYMVCMVYMAAIMMFNKDVTGCI